MASLQAHVAAFLVRKRLRKQLHGQHDIARVRKLWTTPPFPIGAGIQVSQGRAGGIAGEWVEGPKARAAMLYLHGGGYFACSPKTHRPITTSFARAGFRVFAADYRLAPEHVFPAALDDACAAYRGLLSEVAAENIVVAGDSAGGGLSLALMLALRETGTPLPAAGALFSPWTDLAASGASLIENNLRCAMFHGEDIGVSARIYLGDADPRNPLASPLYADLSNLPPLLIHVGADEVLRDDSIMLAERASAAGVRVELKVWPVVPHAWQLAGSLVPEARQSLNEAAAFLLAISGR
jgi:monoterpene epsilon-lactone hydrolase